MKSLLLPAALFVALIVPVAAQDHTGHAAAPDLPPVCLAQATSTHSGMAVMAPTGDEAHQALMAGMDRMNADMMAGGTAADLDTAFICSMIPHHRGAIDMARAELQYGDDAWAKSLAQQIITAQETEIADMLAWLEGK